MSALVIHLRMVVAFAIQEETCISTQEEEKATNCMQETAAVLL